MSNKASHPPAAGGAGIPPLKSPLFSAVKAFTLSRWRGQAPLETVFWRDMIMFGTALNAVTTLGAIGLLIADAPTALALLVFFSPLPVNLFLFFSVWRSAANSDGFGGVLARVGAAIWLALVMVL
jgi:hypothetical protein